MFWAPQIVKVLFLCVYHLAEVMWSVLGTKTHREWWNNVMNSENYMLRHSQVNTLVYIYAHNIITIE